jgi:hypothetical protein
MVTVNKEAGMNGNSGHYASAAGDGEGLPAPSPQDQELMLDAWREALGQVLASLDFHGTELT